MVQYCFSRWFQAGIELVSGLTTCLMISPSALAQITPDGTLGTQVNGSCIGAGGTCSITNGATRGSNLFHSFQQFSLPNGDIAQFQSLPTIQNVIVRVTGEGNGFISNLNGTIQTTNPTNFFLLNPNGIVFGSSVRLNIGGSFLATTAERMQFQDGTVFSTRAPAPLLTIGVPTGLQMGQTPGKIQAQGIQLMIPGGDFFTDFSLIGNDLRFDQSIVISQGRRIGLASLNSAAIVELVSEGNSLGFNVSDVMPRSDITLTNRTVIGVGGQNGGGNVQLDGNNIRLSDRTVISAGIVRGADNTLNNQAGDIVVNATGNLQLINSTISNRVVSRAIGQAGNVNIRASKLDLTDGAEIASRIFGQGNAGNLNVLVGSLSVTNGAQLSTETSGQGNAGNLTIVVRDSAIFDGEDVNNTNSGVSTSVQSGAKGDGGNLSLSSGSLSVTNGAQLNAATFGQGNAGNLSIAVRDMAIFDGDGADFDPSAAGSSVGEGAIGDGGKFNLSTGSLFVTNGAQLLTATSGQGNAGELTIAVRDTATIQGRGRDDFPSGIGSSVEVGSIGDAGKFVLSARKLQISDGAFIKSSSSGKGQAADLTINTAQLQLKRQGLIRASSRSGDGANITLNVGESILLRQSSKIVASAGLADTGGDGGIITINVPKGFLIAVQNENSDISADAFSGSGGSVRLTAQGIYGTQFQSGPTAFSDITASSTFGVSGVVTLNTLELDPNRGLVPLPTGLIDPSNKIDRRCASKAIQQSSSFVITGTGGLPNSPIAPLLQQEALIELAQLPQDETTEADYNRANPIASAHEILEAKGWFKDEQGRVRLVARIPQRFAIASPDCAARGI